MNRPDVLNGVSEIVAQVLTVPLDQVTPTADFYEELGGDSLQKLEVIAHIEARFGCSLTDGQAAESDTAEALAREVLTHVG
ncbi:MULTISPECIES: acyl carrier protein [Streptomyces]|uniref:Carrier domain-containing protein n=2 Tax=Streptomyces TaxID=1883 RepID=A0A0B5F6S5_STRA4|nr:MULTISPECIES: acyl carrier protein [Streptomyces]AJE86052.1 hypothetical protein SLNWT_5676 [Streptomyces albus]AOU80353.1 hypothetical protein SLNHY_5662 [Streptomyces albus]AYN36065.1 hypothetical protein DUI70_5570 [Streptomyces albus]NKI41528.1 acyl carrier protein [Streptomyces physcomitrii]